MHPRLLDPTAETEAPAAHARTLRAATRQRWPALLRAWPHLHGTDPRAPWDTLPLTTKADLRGGYPLGRLAVPRSALRRVHASSGTSGIPTVVAYTEGDLSLWARVVARGLAAVGVEAGTVVHSTLGYGLFTGGLGFHAAAERLGACVVPAAAGNGARHRRLLADLDAEVLLSTPSYAMHLAESADAPLPTVTAGVFGAEPMPDALRSRLEDAWGMRAHDTYGLSEAIGPGVAFECPARAGLHVNADVFHPEVIDPVAGTPLPEGAIGELVLSAPSKEAMPLLRYRTGDLTALDHQPCACGRALPRLRGIRGRVDDMRVVRGVNVYPSQIEAALLRFRFLRTAWQATITRPESLDRLVVVAESDDTRPATQRAVARGLADALGLRVAVTLCPPGTLPPPAGKANRLVDQR